MANTGDEVTTVIRELSQGKRCSRSAVSEYSRGKWDKLC